MAFRLPLAFLFVTRFAFLFVGAGEGLLGLEDWPADESESDRLACVGDLESASGGSSWLLVLRLDLLVGSASGSLVDALDDLLPR